MKNDIKCRFENGEFDDRLAELYGADEVSNQKSRYLAAIDKFCELYPVNDEILVFSAPGRIEIGGNHTDHQHGCVLAAAVNLDAVAVVSYHNDGVIRLTSEGFGTDIVDLSDMEVNEGGYGKSAELIRGVAAPFIKKGVEIGGFDAYVTSDVMGGAGLSSSASFEVLIATIINEHYNNNAADNKEIAKIGQYAEIEYFGKQCGLMDQMACASGGLVFIDFNDTDNPEVKNLMYDFAKDNLSICITDTKCSHADLTDDYVAVPAEMKQVAKYFNEPYLRNVSEEAFYDSIPSLRFGVNDRAVMRAAHFFDENKRAMGEAEALGNGNAAEFLEIVNKSGNSSESLLQNLYSTKTPTNQAIPLAIMMSKRVLAGEGAVRVHGGGFAGTIQAFVPDSKLEKYIEVMDGLFGAGSCHIVRIRPCGGVRIA